MRSLVILDYDGTCTLIKKEEARFGRTFFEQVRRRTNLSQDELEKLVQEKRDLIFRRPHRYGWINNGHIVAGALVDPYIEMRVVADLIFVSTGAINDPQARDDEIEGYFHNLHPSIWSTYKPETETALIAIEQRNPGLNYFVSNSGMKVIQRKLRALKGVDGLAGRIRGHAQKYFLDTEYDAINPKTMMIKGLPRPVHLRRSRYFEVIEDLRIEHGLEWEDVLVVGDIAELDLFMPLALGARVALMNSPRVPDYEREFILSHSRAHLLSHPGEIISLL